MLNHLKQTNKSADKEPPKREVLSELCTQTPKWCGHPCEEAYSTRRGRGPTISQFMTKEETVVSTELKLQDYTCTGTASFSFSFKSIFSTEFLGEPSFSSSLFAVYLPSSVTLPDLGAAAQHERMLLAPNAHETFNI